MYLLPRFLCPASVAVLAAAALSTGGDHLEFSSPLAWKKLASGCKERFAFTAVYEPKRESFVVFDGEASVNGQFDLLDDLWEFKPKENEWRVVNTEGPRPPRRAYHSATFDEKHRVMWLFGGAADAFKPQDDLWKLDTEHWKWTQMSPAGEKPGARFNAGLHYDASRDQLVLHSGCKAFFEPDNAWTDVWTYDIEKNTWSKKKTVAQGRWQAASVLDPELDVLIVHGGYDGNSTVHGDTWIYQLADDKWIAAGKGFKATDAHAAVWDPIAHAMLVYGGTSGAKIGLDQVWAFEPKSKKWSQLTVKGDTPGGRAYHVAIWDPSEKGLWVFGGTMNQFMDEPRKNEAWSLQLHK